MQSYTSRPLRGAKQGITPITLTAEEYDSEHMRFYLMGKWMRIKKNRFLQLYSAKFCEQSN